MKVELTKFRVKEGKSERVDEWITYMQEHMDDVLMTLEGEKMFVETIFREQVGKHEYLYWYSVQDESGHELDDDDTPMDSKHVRYWEECIDKTFRPEDLDASVVMIPPRIRKAMQDCIK
ncbi:DUF6176 family protein [Salinicoccus albus]|uniref:DUF6176 family protein n=1 Tax=Salinicoccus albus TaxID=418756 RepID=UPI00035C8F79|nr:DUF6176 family protein [Salinicoccus albus]